MCLEKFYNYFVSNILGHGQTWSGSCGCLWPLTSVCLQRTIQQFSRPTEETLRAGGLRLEARQINYNFTLLATTSMPVLVLFLKNIDSFIFNWILRIWVKLKLHLFCIIASPRQNYIIPTSQ